MAKSRRDVLVGIQETLAVAADAYEAGESDASQDKADAYGRAVDAIQEAIDALDEVA